MFRKKSRSGANMVAADKVDTIIGRDTHLQGDIDTSGILRIQGKVKGNIKSSNDIIVAEDALVEGDITGTNLVVAGTLMGNCHLDGRLEIGSSGKISGDIKVGALVIQEGGLLEGKCEMPLEDLDSSPDKDEEEIEI